MTSQPMMFNPWAGHVLTRCTFLSHHYLLALGIRCLQLGWKLWVNHITPYRLRANTRTAHARIRSMIWHNNAKMTSKFRSQLEAENAVLQDMVAIGRYLEDARRGTVQRPWLVCSIISRSCSVSWDAIDTYKTCGLLIVLHTRISSRFACIPLRIFLL